MKTCFLYSGHARTIRWLHENHWFRILSKFPNPTIYASVVDDEQADDMKLLEQYVGKKNFFFEKVPQPQIDEPKRTSPYHAGYPTTATPQGVLRQLWHWERVWEFAKDDKSIYDYYVRIRPDSCFLAADLDRLPNLDNEFIYTPWWSKWGGTNDRFAVMNYFCALRYQSLFANREHLWSQGCPLHPESMLDKHLNDRGITQNKRLNVIFAPLRLPDDKHSGPWLDQLQISPIDLAEYSAK